MKIKEKRTVIVCLEIETAMSLGEIKKQMWNETVYFKPELGDLKQIQVNVVDATKASGKKGKASR